MTMNMKVEKAGSGYFVDPEDALQTDEMRALEKMAIEQFRPRGRDYDARSVMPSENIQELHDAGWLTATLSKEIGGKGSNVDSDDPSTFLQGLRMIRDLFPKHGNAKLRKIRNKLCSLDTE